MEYGTKEYYKEKIIENEGLQEILLFAIKGAVEDKFTNYVFIERICVKIAETREKINHAKAQLEKLEKEEK